MDRRIIIAILCLALIVSLVRPHKLWQYGGAETEIDATALMPPVALAPTAASSPAAPPAPPVASAPPAAPTLTAPQVFNFAVKNTQYSVSVPSSPIDQIKINSRVVNPVSYTYSDKALANINIASLRGKPFNFVDALTYLVMFPNEKPIINHIRKFNIPELNRAVDAIIASVGRYRRHFKIIKATPKQSVVLASTGPGDDTPLRLYTATQGEKVSSNGTWINASEYDDQGNLRTDLELKRRTITGKETNFLYNCSTVEGATEFLTDLALYPALTGCNYESYGNRRL